MPYLMCCMAATLHGIVSWLVTGGLSLAWLGALIAIVPMLGFMVYIAVAGVGHTSRYMPLQLFTALLGTALAVYKFEWIPAMYAIVLGLVGVNAYIFWYSGLDRPSNPDLAEGTLLPEFTLKNEQGDSISSRSFMGKPTLFMFYRGNWCPLCVAQIKEVAANYQALSQRGVQVVLVSPQPAQHSRELAQRFNVAMTFAVDEDGRAARQLKIIHENAVPAIAGLGDYDRDSVFPTVLITDAQGKIIWSDLTDNYRVRPDPAIYLEVIDKKLNLNK